MPESLSRALTIQDILGEWSEAWFEELVTAKAMPVRALATCLAYLNEAAPRLRELLNRAADGETLCDSDQTLLFWGVHILGAGLDTRACAPLLRLLQRPYEELDDLLGDALTETLPRIIIGVFDGDDEALFETIANRDVDAFVRWALFSALAFLTFEGRINKERTEALLVRFDEDCLAGEDDQSWVGWQEAIGLLGLRALAERVERRCKSQVIIDVMGDGMEAFYEALKHAEASPDDEARFAESRLGYIDDICEALDWVSFGEDEDKVFVPSEDRFAFRREPVVNPWRDVGRNDPCPCGSGKKAKKCCLA